jgi:hypothetical protein
MTLSREQGHGAVETELNTMMASSVMAIETSIDLEMMSRRGRENGGIRHKAAAVDVDPMAIRNATMMVILVDAVIKVRSESLVL